MLTNLVFYSAKLLLFINANLEFFAILFISFVCVGGAGKILFKAYECHSREWLS